MRWAPSEEPPPSHDQKRLIQATLSGSLFVTGGALGADRAENGLLAFGAAIVLAYFALGAKPFWRSDSDSWLYREEPPEPRDDERH